MLVLVAVVVDVEDVCVTWRGTPGDDVVWFMQPFLLTLPLHLRMERLEGSSDVPCLHAGLEEVDLPRILFFLQTSIKKTNQCECARMIGIML